MKKVFKQDGERQMIIFDDLTEMSFEEYKNEFSKNTIKSMDKDVKNYKKGKVSETISLDDVSDILDKEE